MKKIVLSLAAVLLFANANSEVKNPISISLKSYQKSVKVSKDGKKITKWVAPTKVVPGTIIKYVATITNTQNKPIESATVVSNIDDNLIFIPKSIDSKLKYNVEFSVDKKRFAPADKLTITTKDGKTYSAKAKDYRAIKFKLLNIPANSKSSISYQAKVK